MKHKKFQYHILLFDPSLIVKKMLSIMLIILLTIFAGCMPSPQDVVKIDEIAPIYPDYRDVTIPVNIAPLNFMIRDNCQAIWVQGICEDKQIVAKSRGNQIKFDICEWKKFLESSIGKSITIRVISKVNDLWQEYQPFTIKISPDSIDPYLTYRLIEPDYEVFSRLKIKERCVEDFSERDICDYNEVGNRCMNCHTYGNQNPDLSFMYIRGEGGGLILNQKGTLRKLNLKTNDMVSGSVYAQFSPNGSWLVFSTNIIIPGFHADPSKRLEVFDTKSDVFILNLNNNKVIRSPLLADSIYLSTFPTFSPDGKYIYFCRAKGPAEPNKLDSVQYSLCRIGFDESTGLIGSRIDTIIEAQYGKRQSISHPRISPDGIYVLYTVADYGTFPICHNEADLQMINLFNGEIYQLDLVNSDKSDTYHSWSSTGKWFVFASKRDDGLYGKPYFSHVDREGIVSKPFVLPQKEPKFYDNNLKSFNVPELGKGKIHFTASDLIKILQTTPEVVE